MLTKIVLEESEIGENEGGMSRGKAVEEKRREGEEEKEEKEGIWE